GSGGDRTVSQLSIHQRDDPDYFRITPPVGGTLNVSAPLTSTPGLLDVFLNNASGTSIGFGYGAASAPVVGGQVYYVSIYADGFTVPSYDLTIDVPDFPADRFEPNDTRAAAADLGLSGDRVENNLSLHA